jgi:hypothetical protein
MPLPLLPGAMLWLLILIVFGGVLAIALAIGTEPRPHPWRGRLLGCGGVHSRSLSPAGRSWWG